MDRMDSNAWQPGWVDRTVTDQHRTSSTSLPFGTDKGVVYSTTRRAPAIASRYAFLRLALELVILVAVGCGVFGAVSRRFIAGSATTPTCFTTSQIIHTEINSTILTGNHELYIYLPAGYCSAPTQRYASLYLLHGAPGGAGDWAALTNLQQTTDRLIAQHAIPPMIIVMPDGNYGAVGDTFWVNGNPAAGFGRVEDYMTDEVVPFIDAHYRTTTQRGMRAIGGLSAGAYGSMNIALHHPDMFSVVAAMSGTYQATPTDAGIDLFAGDPELTHRNSPIELLDDVTDIRSLALYFDVGTDDPWFVDDSEAFDHELTVRNIPHEFHVYSGGHDWDYWRTHLPDALRFVGAHLDTSHTTTNSAKGDAK